MSYSIKIDGFKNKSQAKAFIQWYEGDGEQSASSWFKARHEEGKIDVDFMPIDIKKTYPLMWENDTLLTWIKL